MGNQARKQVTINSQDCNWHFEAKDGKVYKNDLFLFNKDHPLKITLEDLVTDPTKSDSRREYVFNIADNQLHYVKESAEITVEPVSDLQHLYKIKSFIWNSRPWRP